MTGLFDIHCHIIPGVDDGSENIEESIKMLNMEYEEGVRTIIATPHFRAKMFETSSATIFEQYQYVKKEAETLGIRLFLGCEFHAKMDMAALLKEGRVSSMAGSRYVLTEFSDGVEKSYVKERLFSLISKGYKPIIAHIERYESVCKDFDFIEEMVEIGAKTQVNTSSITGQDGFGIKRFCKKLMKEDLLHFVGTDAHGCKKRVPQMQEAYNYVSKKMGEDYAKEIFVLNPAKIVKHAEEALK